MRRYDHGGDIYSNPGVTLDFSVSTNPLGMPGEIRRALISRVDEFARYPDPECRELRAALSRYEDVPEKWVLCGNGAADLIYRLCLAVKPRRALVCAPTFSEYERALKQTGCRILRHNMTSERQFALTGDILSRLVPGVDMLFLCNPNNPTGRLIPEKLLERILVKARLSATTVVVDECFLDFTEGISCKHCLSDMPGLVILKAFTKLYSMAGLRLGYLLASDASLLDKVSSAGQCWSVSVPAQIAGAAALECRGWAEKTRRVVSEERRFLSGGLGEIGITVFSGEANFLLLRSEQPLYEPLLQKGILIRRCENFCGLDDSYYRVGLKTHGENIRLLQAARKGVES